ncbi:WASH complex subunit 2-like [Daphnia carinata]|uniref:WASH complex subunit 2-like n=1 Tax=Daphnia carinata TaxID=120202 RepID=UPI00257A7037|nr:WASH complex subunit 2-like [Daphnia carinata]
MEQIKDSEDPNSWTPAYLRKCQSLSLASDVALLKCMQALSQRMVSSANSLLKDLDSLNEDTTSACVKVEYCIQNLNLISTKQFMEKRVYDEEVLEKKEESTIQSQPATAAIDFVPKIKEAIREGLPAIKLQVETFEYAAKGNVFQSLNRGHNNHYSNRSLPYLLGTEEFIDSPTVGVSEGHQFKRESVPNIQPPSHPSNSTVSSVPSSPSLKSNLQVPLPVDIRPHSDSDVSSLSEAGGRVSVETKEVDEMLKRPGLRNLQDEISARLKNSSGPTVMPSPEAYTTPYAKVPINGESQRQEVKEINPRGAVAEPQPNSEIASSKEIIQPPKKKTLFDDSSSESDGELFRSNASKAATSSTSALNPTASKASSGSTAHQPPMGKNNNPVALGRTSNLFGSSDSEDDLFSAAVSSNVKSSKSIPKLTGKIGTSVYDDEENIFLPKNTTKEKSQSAPSMTITLPADKPQSLFKDLDVPDFIQTKPNLPVNAAVPTANKPQDKLPVQQAKQLGFDQPKPKSLFADSDESDEDLFRNIVAVKNKVPALVVPPTTLSTSPLPDKIVTHSSRHQSTPIQNGDKKEEQTRPASGPDSSTEPVRVESHSKLKSKSSLLFDDDSDDEDLFKGVTVKKYSPPKTNAPALKNVQKVSKDDSLKEVLVPKPAAHVAQVIESLDDGDLFSSALPAKPPSLLGVRSVTQKPEDPPDESSVAIAKTTEKSIFLEKKQSIPQTAISSGDLTAKPIPVSSKLPEILPTNISNDLFGGKSTPVIQPPQRQNIPILNTFEDPDDDDLFGISNSKQVPLSMPIKTSLKSEERENLIKTEELLDAVLKQTQPFSLDPVISSKAIEKIQTPESDISQSLETEVVSQTSANTFDKIPSRIASLKLTLAKQPNSMPFSNTGSSASTPNEEDGNTPSHAIVRKPFGATPLFGPRIPSPVKSVPPSPTKTEQKIMPRVEGNENNRESEQNNDPLDCLNRQRPKAPSRRLPSRNFRRSRIQDDDDELPQVEEAHQSPLETTSISTVVNQVVSEPLPASEPPKKPTTIVVDEMHSQLKPAERSLFDDSDSSDGELFKVKTPANKLSKTEAPVKSGGLKSNAKINSSLLGSGSDDSSVFSSHQVTIPTPKITTPSFLLADSDDDDDLFATTPKRRLHPKPDLTTVVGASKAGPAATDPLLNFQE